jgi:hypothetical protein
MCILYAIAPLSLHSWKNHPCSCECTLTKLVIDFTNAQPSAQLAECSMLMTALLLSVVEFSFSISDVHFQRNKIGSNYPLYERCTPTEHGAALTKSPDVDLPSCRHEGKRIHSRLHTKPFCPQNHSLTNAIQPQRMNPHPAVLLQLCNCALTLILQ